MTILLIGSGAREHAIARSIKKSSTTTALFCFGSSNNPGIRDMCLDYKIGSMTNTAEIIDFANANDIRFAIIGPEAPLKSAIVDELKKISIPSVGPIQELAQIETSKSYTRDLMNEYNIPGMPKYKKFANLNGVSKYIDELGGNYVIKADGLMGGKGVKVSGEHLNSKQQAESWCKQILDKGMSFVIEEKFIGQEFSLMSFCDGKNLKHMPAVQDHKRAYCGDNGPNTGGMGSYTDTNHSLSFLNQEDIEKAKQINQITINALVAKTGKEYKGILYGGFIATREGVKLIEYNARFGDPEAMNVLAILKTDFLEVCKAIINGNLDTINVEFENKATVCKYAVPEGYPDNPIKNNKIDISKIENKNLLYLAAVDQKNDGLYETGSRTVAVVGIGNNIDEAEKIAEAEISKIEGPIFHREDIGTKKLIDRKIDHMMSLLR